MSLVDKILSAILPWFSTTLPSFFDVSPTLPFVTKNEQTLQFGSLTSMSGMDSITGFVVGKVYLWIYTGRAIQYTGDYDAEITVFGTKNNPEIYYTTFDGLYTSRFVDVYAVTETGSIKAQPSTRTQLSDKVSYVVYDILEYKTDTIKVINNDLVFPAIFSCELVTDTRKEYRTFVLPAKSDDPFPISLTMPYGIDPATKRAEADLGLENNGIFGE